MPAHGTSARVHHHHPYQATAAQSLASRGDPDREGCFSCRWRKKRCKFDKNSIPSPDSPCVDCARFNIVCDGAGLERPPGKALANVIRKQTRAWIMDKVNRESPTPLDLAPLWQAHPGVPPPPTLIPTVPVPHHVQIIETVPVPRESPPVPMTTFGFDAPNPLLFQPHAPYVDAAYLRQGSTQSLSLPPALPQASVPPALPFALVPRQPDVSFGAGGLPTPESTPSWSDMSQVTPPSELFPLESPPLDFDLTFSYPAVASNHTEYITPVSSHGSVYENYGHSDRYSSSGVHNWNSS